MLISFDATNSYSMSMCRIDPLDSFRHLNRLNIRQIDRNRLVVTPDQYTLQRLIFISIDLLMRHIRRHKDEIAWPSFSSEFQLLAPTHASLALDDVDHGFQVAMVVGASFGVRMDVHRAGPDFLSAGAGEVDGSGAVHAWRLRCVAVERVCRNDSDAFVFPAILGWRGDF